VHAGAVVEGFDVIETASRVASREAKALSGTSSSFSVLKKLSTIALSYGIPGRLMLSTTCAAAAFAR